MPLLTARGRALALTLLTASGLLAATIGAADAAVSAIPLKSAASFAVLASSGITNDGPTTIDGAIGTYPSTTITGRSSMTVTGTSHGGDAVTRTAETDLVAAYAAALDAGPASVISASLGGQTLTPGVYNTASPVGLTGTLTLNGGGDSNAVFVLKVGSTLTTSSASKVVLENGAQSCNVFWRVGSSATLASDSSFSGTILALSSISIAARAVVDGRVFARSGSVRLDAASVTVPTCTASTTAATTGATTTSTAITTSTVAKVPSSHTGEPWGGWPYWLLVAVATALGVSALEQARRHHAASHRKL